MPALFKLEPKESLEELYDFEKELEKLSRGYEGGKICTSGPMSRL